MVSITLNGFKVGGESRSVLVIAEAASTEDLKKYARVLIAEQKLDRVVYDKTHMAKPRTCESEGTTGYNSIVRRIFTGEEPKYRMSCSNPTRLLSPDVEIHFSGLSDN